MATVTLYLVISMVFQVIVIWWLYNHFDSIFNMQMKLDDTIIKRLVDMETRISELESSEPINENTTQDGIEAPQIIVHTMDKLKEEEE
jgi:hypothetical protein